METEEKQSAIEIGEMHKRCEKMADEKRYIIYYSFTDNEEHSKSNEVASNV